MTLHAEADAMCSRGILQVDAYSGKTHIGPLVTLSTEWVKEKSDVS